MDKYDVIVETTAVSDLRDIYQYITETLKEPVVAKRIHESIKEKVYSLDQIPQRHPLVRDEILAGRGLRWMPVENYSILYIIDEANYKVNVIRILYSRRELQNIL